MSSKRRYSTAAYATFRIDLWDELYQARPWASTTGSVAERHHPGQVRQTRTAGSSLCPIAPSGILLQYEDRGIFFLGGGPLEVSM